MIEDFIPLVENKTTQNMKASEIVTMDEEPQSASIFPLLFPEGSFKGHL